MLRLWRFINNGLGIWLHDPNPEVDATNWEIFRSQHVMVALVGHLLLVGNELTSWASLLKSKSNVLCT